MKRQNARHFAHNTNGRYMEDDSFLGGKYDGSHRRSDVGFDDDDDEEINIELQLNKTTTKPVRHKNYLEAEIQKGDTLQAIAIRFNCSVAELKRINKIEREFEIHARKTLRVPLTIDTVLLEHLPIVHKSGQCSPKHKKEIINIKNNGISNSIISTNTDTVAAASSSIQHTTTTTTATTNPNNSSQLPNKYLNEKLMVAVVSLSPSTENHPIQSSAAGSSLSTTRDQSINDIILQSQITSKQYKDYHDEETISLTNGGYDESCSSVDDLLLPEPQPRSIPSRGIMKTDLSCSGSDCDMSWVVLFICILALCFAIPLIYVIYIAEHPEHHHHIF